jgi:hypothetical protein
LSIKLGVQNYGATIGLQADVRFHARNVGAHQN